MPLHASALVDFDTEEVRKPMSQTEREHIEVEGGSVVRDPILATKGGFADLDGSYVVKRSGL
jgi:hypothetical protein